MRPLALCFGCFLAACALLSSLLIVTLIVAPPSNAQTQQPFLFAGEASQGQFVDYAVFVRDDQTGNLTEVSGSPFSAIHSHTCVMSIVDPKGRFAYAPCGLGAAMYSLNATTGELAEVNGSPFAGSTDTRAKNIAAESTGQYIYVLKFGLNDSYPANSAVLLDVFQVDAGGQQLVPQQSQIFQLQGTLVQTAASQHGFYLLLNQDQSGPYPLAALYGILFDPTSGVASGPQLLAETSNNARSMLIDSSGKNLAVSAGAGSGSLWFLQLSSADGTVSAANAIPLALQEFAEPVAFDPTSSFLYLRFAGTGATTGVRIYSVASLQETPSSPLPPSLESEVGGQPDPQGPFAYSPGPAPGGGISVFGVDPVTGYPVSPTFTNPLFPGRSLSPGPATVDVNTQPVQAPAVSLTTNALNFGSVDIGETSPVQTVTLTNTGGLALSLTSIQLTGANVADFSETDTCMNSPQVQPGKSCVISVTYHPSAASGSSASITITDNASGSPQQVALSGTGTNPPPPPPPAPAVTLNPNPLNFPGTVTEGTISAPQNVVLTNSGNATLHVQTIVLGGANASDFTIASDNCIGQVAANTNCVVALTFAPSGPGVRTAVLTLTDDASNSPQNLNVLGTASAAPAPAVSLNPSPLNFSAAVTEGTISAPQNVVLTNSGNATLHVQTIALGGTNASDFTIASNNCIGQLAANANCVVSLTFAPSGPGVRTAVLTMTDDASNSPQTLNVLGTGGMAAQIGTAPGNGSTAVSVTAGQAAQFNLQVTPGPGFSGTLSFTCAGAPLAATCSAPPVTVSNGAAATFTVTVTTSGSGALIPDIPKAPVNWVRLSPAPVDAFALLLVVLLIVSRAWSQSRLRARAWQLAAGCMLLAAAGLTGCAGGGGGGSSIQQQNVIVTPAGVYTIAVTPTATSTATSKQFQLSPITLTLTVK